MTEPQPVTPQPVAPPWWHPRIRERWAALKAEHASPARLGVAVGVGVFAGCSPFLGIQSLIAIGLAYALRLNKLAVLIGLQISVPPITPLVVFAGLQLGALMLHQQFLPLSLSEIRQLSGGSPGRTLAVDFVVGSLTLGVVLGACLGLATTWTLNRRSQPTS